MGGSVRSVYVRGWQTSRSVVDSGGAAMRSGDLWRRGSTVLRVGVSLGHAVASGSDRPVEGIITGTGLGCMSDTVRFLDRMVEEDSPYLSATPFMNSTFNAIGAQVALLLECRGYNMSFVDNYKAFEDALLDAHIRVGSEDGETRLLVGAYDEQTPLGRQIVSSWGHGVTLGEAACTFGLVGTEGDVELLDVYVSSSGFGCEDDARSVWGIPQECEWVLGPSASEGFYPTRSAESFSSLYADLVGSPSRREVLLYHGYPDGTATGIHLRRV